MTTSSEAIVMAMLQSLLRRQSQNKSKSKSASQRRKATKPKKSRSTIVFHDCHFVLLTALFVVQLTFSVGCRKRRLQRSDSDSDSDAASDAEIFMQKAQEFKSKGGRRSAKVKSSEFVSDSDSDGEVAPAAAAAAPASLEADAGAGGASDQDDGNDAGGDGAAGDGGSTPMEDVEAADASE
eukprot:m.202952 g.202952  ORF g.202952 m.202952 type:complete len:181 (+) comp18445_c0_seq4:2987-3529(+)